MAKLNKRICFRTTTVFSTSDVGIYSIYPKDDSAFHSYWDTCREQFAKKFRNNSYGFFFTVLDDMVMNVPNFIEVCEKILQIKNKSKFYQTERKNIIFIRPAKFWLRCYIRRSLFTLLCRQGIMFNNKCKFEDLLLGNIDDDKNDKITATYKFARQTKNAILRFFVGYTHYVGVGPNFKEYFPEKHGWVHEFKDKSENYIKKVLVADKNTDLSLKFFSKSVILS